MLRKGQHCHKGHKVQLTRNFNKCCDLNIKRCTNTLSSHVCYLHQNISNYECWQKEWL